TRPARRGGGAGADAGLRLLPGAAAALPAAELLAAAAQSPTPVEAVRLHRTRPAGRGEFGHVYRTQATRLGDRPGTWTALTLSAAEPAAAGAWFAHRLGLLGLRARPLAAGELAAAAAAPPALTVARAGGAHRRRPLRLRPGPAHAAVPAAPAQLLGVDDRGAPVALALPALAGLTVLGDPDRAVPLIGACLVTGAAVGIRTTRPPRFAAAVGLGARLVGARAPAELDVLVHDGPRPPGPPAPGAPTPVRLLDPGAAGRARPGTAAHPVLELRERTWRLDAGAGARVIRPLQLG
ncbi:MAG: hypothetical protein Q4P43_11065, partial [Corynebacterium sphenisci]|nr:hypothetical protein [Corynebacterium sphenisci]